MRLIDADILKEAFIVNTDRKGYLVVDPEVIIDNAPIVEPAFKPITEVKFDKEQLQEIVDKVKAEVLASVERPQGEWITFPTNHSIIQCPECTALLNNLRVDIFKDKIGEMNFCPNCGASMKPKANQLRDCENCIHHSDNGCEVWECEFEKRSDL